VKIKMRNGLEGGKGGRRDEQERCFWFWVVMMMIMQNKNQGLCGCVVLLNHLFFNPGSNLWLSY
jgi:hypothetical protein